MNTMTARALASISSRLIVSMLYRGGEGGFLLCTNVTADVIEARTDLQKLDARDEAANTTAIIACLLKG